MSPDHKILAALSRGLTTSTDVAAAAGLTERTVQLALVRMLDGGRVVRTRTGSGYVWTVAS